VIEASTTRTNKAGHSLPEEALPHFGCERKLEISGRSEISSRSECS
jgi:hypothetical protein